MNTVSKKKSSVKKALLVRDKLSQFSYTKKKDPKVPFGLGPDSAPLLSEILEDDNPLTESVVSLMARAKAEGTITTYECAVKRFKDFCSEKGYDYPKIGEKAVLHYIIQQNKDGAFMAILNQIKPALMLVEQLSGARWSAFTETADVMLSAAKRRAAETKPVTKKACQLPNDILHMLFPVCFLPAVKDRNSADPVKLRTFVRDTVIYFTFCPFNCYSKLRAMDFEDDGDSIRITFPSAKNDQYHNGRTTCLVANDTVVNPVEIVCTYFKLCNFKFGQKNGDTSLVNCTMRKTKTSWFADGRRGVCYFTSTKNVQDMVSTVGVDPTGITDKSFKMLGVTRTLNLGVPLDDVAQHGRWLTASMPLHYKHNSFEYKVKIAKLVPI
jgi:hypothetical protein